MLPINWYWPVGIFLLLLAGAAWGWWGIHSGEGEHVPNPDSGLAAAQEESARRQKDAAAGRP